MKKFIAKLVGGSSDGLSMELESVELEIKVQMMFANYDGEKSKVTTSKTSPWERYKLKSEDPLEYEFER